MKHLLLYSALILSTGICRGQCYPDRHSTDWFDGWISCEAATIPDGSQEKGHWILYDFGEVYKLGQMTIWNTNDPAHLDWGMRDVRVETSLDGSLWNEAGMFAFEQATGTSIYEGFQGPDLGGVEARYLLIIGLNNWGGECYGLSEVRIAAEETVISSIDEHENDCFSVSAYPNPFTIDSDVEINSQCADSFTFSVTDVLGRIVRTGEQSGQTGSFNLNVDMTSLPQGTYYLRVRQGENSSQLTLVKMDRS